MGKRNFQRSAAQRGMLKLPICAPRGFAVGLRGATVSSPQSGLETMCFAGSKLFHNEEDHMKHSTLSILCPVAILSFGLAAPLAMADGRRANATVSFGAWQTDPPLDRFPINSPVNRNEHQLIPHKVKIKAGGTVNFIIGGFHQVIVYGPGTEPGDVDANLMTPSTGVPLNVALIDDPENRIYRGLDPSRLHLVDPVVGNPSIGVRDRVEVVHFPKPGTYLVICGIQGHFVNDGMFGFVKVRPEDDDD
jgi:plastocyanin